MATMTDTRETGVESGAATVGAILRLTYVHAKDGLSKRLNPEPYTLTPPAPKS